MRYRRLGHSGLFVSELCLGTMTFGGGNDMWGQIGQLGQEEADALVQTAHEAGVNFFDTANVYASGRSEEILGQAIRNLGVPREEVVLATKVHGQMGEGPNARGASRGHILDQAKASLKRLQVDHIDLYQLHGIDPATPVEETLEALDMLVRHGHVRYIGVSNWAAWQIARAVGVAEARRLAPIVSLQAYYTLAGRDLEREIVPMLTDANIGLMVWSPLAGGFLSGKFDRDGKTPEGRRAAFDFPPIDKDRAYDAIEVMRGIAHAKDCTVAQVALAWLLHQPVVTSVLVGAKREDQLTDNLGAVDVRLSGEDLAALDKVTRLPVEYPGWMIEQQSSYRRQLIEDERR
ncbi:aldo/keto reductase [Maritimibacter sp. UBA3975]|uniref:aldo/keto reductase n=1 Tax=Maritimibacter sp. UBA3975 TaxID=1946833 RepID=UPI000C0B0140|nr:aldo/keto reductase [Maritimibacter sp. UBA3975]MAM61656.1 aldo/keto reductase [Maritimibacter sp.]|tara:strand:- start:572 stop:1612 length:1041 start_codon:yes stop_codon:yes gene_type:complete